MRRIFFLTIYSALLLSLSAAEERLEDQYIGASAGLTTGIGLTYRYWPEEWGFQGTYMPYWDYEQFGSQIGFTAFRTLFEGKITRLFLYGSGNYILTAGPETMYDEITGEEKILNEFRVAHDGGIGIGPSLEVILFDHIAIDLMFGYALSTLEGGLSFTGETGIYYRF